MLMSAEASSSSPKICRILRHKIVAFLSIGMESIGGWEPYSGYRFCLLRLRGRRKNKGVGSPATRENSRLFGVESVMFLEFLGRIKIPPAPFSRGSSGLRPQKKLENLSWNLLDGVI